MIGVDIIALSRMEEIIQRSGLAFLQRVFSEEEIRRAQDSPCPTHFYASAFAAKEAVFKALNLGWEQEVDFKEIQIYREPGGRPVVKLTDSTAERARSAGYRQVLISISYETDMAIVMAMAHT